MKYKDLNIGDWYKYGANNYIITQAPNGEIININLATGVCCLPLGENIEVKFCSSLNPVYSKTFCGRIDEAPYGIILQPIEEKEYYIKPFSVFSSKSFIIVSSANGGEGTWLDLRSYNYNVKDTNGQIIKIQEGDPDHVSA